MSKLGEKISMLQRARGDITRILDRYCVTLPEVMGITRSRIDPDEEIWGRVKKDYEGIQEEMLKERYPRLWASRKKR